MHSASVVLKINDFKQHKKMKKLHTLFLLSLIATSLFSQTLPSYLPADGLVGWWPFNGNANDESGNGNNGTVNGATLTMDRNGNGNSAYTFDGNLNKITVFNPQEIPVGNSNYSLSVWIYSEGNNNGHIIWYGQPVSNGCNALRLAQDYCNNANQGNQGVCNYWYYNDACFCESSNGSTLTNNSWHQILVTYDGLKRQVYIDGNLVNQLQGSSMNINSITELVFGYYPYYQYYSFSGSLDDIAIYNRALTQEEITALYTGTPINGGGGNSSANSVPPGIPYQAVVRNANGQVAANTAVTTRFTLHQNTADGAVEYQETHALTTNAQGLMSTILGQGTAVQNTFANINWANTAKFLQVEVDLGNGYVDMGAQQLMSVPYSIQSQTATTINNTGLPIYANNAAALAGGLTSGQLYRTATGDLKIVY
jgi:hypothetical protein